MSAKPARQNAVELEDVDGNIIRPYTSAYTVWVRYVSCQIPMVLLLTNILQITFAVTLGAINYGYASAVIAGALALPSFNELFLSVNTSPRIGAILGM